MELQVLMQDPTVPVRRICERFDISKATLYRCGGTAGGVVDRHPFSRGIGMPLHTKTHHYRTRAPSSVYSGLNEAASSNISLMYSTALSSEGAGPGVSSPGLGKSDMS